MKKLNFSDIVVDNINDAYDLPIDAYMSTDFWILVKDTFLLSFGRMMVKYDLGIDSFDLFLNLYKESDVVIDDIDKFIEVYLEIHDEDFTRTEVNSLVPIEKNGLYYSKSWGSYC